MNDFEWKRIDGNGCRVGRWSGGTTAEIAIDPAGADYAERSFAWRVSAATIEAERSEFTPLGGYRRLLMVLEGELTLRHDGHGTFALRPYETNAFEGGLRTSSEGKARDLNVIYGANVRARMNVLVLPGRGSLAVPAGGEAFREGERLLHRLWHAAEGAVLVLGEKGELVCRLGVGDSQLMAIRRGERAPAWRLANEAPGPVRVAEAWMFQ